MKRTSKKNFVKFLVLFIIVLVLGVVLQNQGNLTNPLESTIMMISMSSGESGFAMAGERQAPAENVDSTSTTSNTETAVAESNETVESVETTESNETVVETTDVSTTETMTMETFTAELAAAGVDVDAVSATMSAEGRSLENLLAVVNSGRVSVEDLATRLKGESTTSTSTEGTASAENTEVTHTSTSSSSLFDIRWDSFGSVLFNLWFILVVTIVVIVLARPVSWLTNQLRRAKSA